MSIAGTISGTVSSTASGAVSGASASSTLLDGLVSWWSMDEASGTRVDSHGSNDLTDNNAVGSTTGKVSNAAQFVAANSEYFSRASFTIDGAYTFACWVKADTLSGDQFVCELGGTNAKDLFRWSAGGNEWTARPVGTVLRSGVVPVTGTWYLVAFGHDGSASGGFISVNGAAKVTQSVAFASTTATAQIGRKGSGAYWDGQIDEAALWSRELTADELTELYNSGNGIGYPG